MCKCRLSATGFCIFVFLFQLLHNNSLLQWSHVCAYGNEDAAEASLYVPVMGIKRGQNAIIILEIINRSSRRIRVSNAPTFEGVDASAAEKMTVQNKRKPGKFESTEDILIPHVELWFDHRPVKIAFQGKLVSSESITNVEPGSSALLKLLVPRVAIDDHPFAIRVSMGSKKLLRLTTNKVDITVK